MVFSSILGAVIYDSIKNNKTLVGLVVLMVLIAIVVGFSADIPFLKGLFQKTGSEGDILYVSIFPPAFTCKDMRCSKTLKVDRECGPARHGFTQVITVNKKSSWESVSCSSNGDFSCSCKFSDGFYDTRVSLTCEPSSSKVRSDKKYCDEKDLSDFTILGDTWDFDLNILFKDTRTTTETRRTTTTTMNSVNFDRNLPFNIIGNTVYQYQNGRWYSYTPDAPLEQNDLKMTPEDYRWAMKQKGCDCPPDEGWSTCTNAKEVRTIYKCDDSTNFVCRETVEERPCGTSITTTTIGECNEDDDCERNEICYNSVCFELECSKGEIPIDHECVEVPWFRSNLGRIFTGIIVFIVIIVIIKLINKR